MSNKIIFSPGSFFHGTKADLNIGDFLVTGMKKIITILENPHKSKETKNYLATCPEERS